MKKKRNKAYAETTANISKNTTKQNAMAFIGVTQYNHNNNQQIDEYEYDDMDNFYDDGPNFGSYLDVDDSEGNDMK